MHYSEFFVDNNLVFIYYIVMYVTDKNLNFHLKEMMQQIREVAKDLDIRYLNQEIHEINEKAEMMEKNLEELVEIVAELRGENG